MYLGTRTDLLPIYRTRYVPGIGDLNHKSGVQERTLEGYQCEVCGKEHWVMGKAEERFYCKSCVNVLMGIEPAPTA